MTGLKCHGDTEEDREWTVGPGDVCVQEGGCRARLFIKTLDCKKDKEEKCDGAHFEAQERCAQLWKLQRNLVAESGNEVNCEES